MSVHRNRLLTRLRAGAAPADVRTVCWDTPNTGRSQSAPKGHDELTVFIVAGEYSGDALGAGLMSELTRRRKGLVRFLGVGGEAMEAQGLTSLFPLGDIAVMGPGAILKALPRLTNRVYRTVAAGHAARPDVIVIIDAPEFTHRVARRLRRKLPYTPIIDYVCPSVWAWRPGRAKVMARFIDHVLTLLPFEPDALERLGGPPATYVGHPLVERRDWIKGLEVDAWSTRFALDPTKTPLVVLPGSRGSEVERLLPIFSATLARLRDMGHNFDVLLPAVANLRARIQDMTADWPENVQLVDGEEAKFAAFRIARAALAASGTVTLQLGLTGTPMVVAYRVEGLAAPLRFLIKVPSVVLANLIINENAFPEYLQKDCTPDKLAAGLDQILKATPDRQAQLKALEKLDQRMQLGASNPSGRAADIVMRYAAHPATASPPL